MATTVMQIRIDNDLKAQAGAVFDQLGIDIPTAIRMFMRRAVLVNGIPFSLTLPEQDYKAERAAKALYSLSKTAEKNGTAEMTLDEINAEIAAARAERMARNTKK